MRLTGQVASVSNYALQGRVLEKYAPKQDAENFYVRLAGVDRPVWFSVAHFSKFEPLDEVGVVDCRGFWVRPSDTVVVIRPAVIPVQEVILELGYVSNPRHVEGGQYWYMFKLRRWFRCHYDVAARFWLGDDTSQDSLLAADYYTLLGVDRDVSFPGVRTAWKRMIIEHHPDRFVSGHSKEVHDYHARLAARINAARDCLTDVGERERYNRQLQSGYSGPQQEDIRAWPGRGFGTLRAKVEDRASVVLVKEILSWEPERYVFEGTISLDQARSWGDEVRVKVPILQGIRQVGQETLAIPKDLLPPEVVRAVERRRDGMFSGRLQGIRTGAYSMDKGEVYTWIRVQEAEVEWTPIRDAMQKMQKRRYV